MAGSLSDWFKSPSTAERLRAAGVRADLIEAVSRTAFSRQSDSMLTSVAGLLSDDEVVIDLVEGRNHKRVGLLVLTTQRILFIPQTNRSPMISIALADVVAVAGRTHRGMGAVTFTLADDDLTVDQILGTQADGFASHVLSTKIDPDPMSATPATPDRDPIDELIELRALHRAGVVSGTEFELRKKQLFDRI